MKNKISLLLLLIFSLSLSACSQNNVESGVTQPSSTAQEARATSLQTSVTSLQTSAATKETSAAAQETSVAAQTVKPIDSFTIKFIGNSCFYIEASNGTKIVTDPYYPVYDDAFAPFPDIKPDIMTISHYHNDHAGIDRFKDVELKNIKDDVLAGQSSFGIGNGQLFLISPECLKKEIDIGGVKITGYPSKHDADENLDNTIFVFKAGDLKIVHMGCTDKIDDPDAIDAIKGADVIIAYAGEQGSVTNKEIFAFIYKMNIKVITPHHYSMGQFPFYGSVFLDQVLKELPKGLEVVKADELVVKKGLKKEFVVLSPMGKK